MWKYAYGKILPSRIFESFEFEKEFKLRAEFIKNHPGHFYVAELNGIVKGFFTAEELRSVSQVNGCQVDGEVGVIYVEPNFEGKGIGSIMFDYARKIFNKKHYKNFLVWCLRDNEVGKSFYLKKQKGKIIAERIINLSGFEANEIAILFEL